MNGCVLVDMCVDCGLRTTCLVRGFGSHIKRRLDVRLAVVVAACCKVPEHGLDDNGATCFCCPVEISMFDDINDWSWIWLVTPSSPQN